MIKLTLVLTFISTCAIASDIIEFRNGIIFNHRGHQIDKVGNCYVCHDNVSVSEDTKKVTTTDPGKIKGFGTEWSHRYCKDCHDLYGEGPVDCQGCHRKKASFNKADRPILK